ncbi:unnamed protein product (macronuclear) [Paramecium tetraurelia]|uniref:Uncharacterized protein n=1 Tax=Paramecium tetraurelia TaxID=5888 RepID=A0DTC7_PARTE|nr:uncharacterized protein GSPATT00039750001 [Paramecium tetraurelia]CAK86294.1 unnamed protein product [Paramecium tetraurelia]|eukprot:XP_001453691.1 hypothetical protein (macronuclear) [Paramecium tetraurelia strain d4-2]
MKPNFRKSGILHLGKLRDGSKVGNWEIWYKNNQQIGGGLYDQSGNELKYGKWTDIDDNFERNQINYTGEYEKGKKVGLWKSFIKENNFIQLLAFVTYNSDGQEIFRSEGNSGILHLGKLKDGNKIGKWEIWYKNNQQIGGGLYDESGKEFKVGYWVEIIDCYDFIKQIIFKGEYLYGQKYGKWSTWYKKYEETEFKQIGGGFYDDGIKIGKWIELHDNYGNFFGQSQIQHYGEYKCGNKIGLWQTSFMDELIAGGFYDENGNGEKNGKWIELSDHYGQSQIKYVGEYANGNKIGFWNTYYKEFNTTQFQIIGVGEYHQGIRIGKWIELIDNQGQSLITWQGEYLNGKKIGQWEIKYKENYDNQFFYGGGSYDQLGNESKIGQWIELSDGFFEYSQITFNGQYKNGKKYNNWEIHERPKNYQNFSLMQKLFLLYFRGGGVYCENEIKIGRWVEQNANFRQQEIIHVGKYKNGSKIGLWHVFYKGKDMQIFKYYSYIQWWWFL